MNVKLTIVQKPFPQLLSALQAGEVDIVMSGISITPQRAVDVKFVGPYMFSGKSILTKSATLAEAEDADDINQANPKLVALANSTSQDYAKKNLPQAELATTQDYESAVKMVLDGKADAMVADMPICLLSVLRHPGQGLATLATPLNIEPIGVAVPANDPHLESLIENYINSLEATTILDRLKEKWFEDGSWISSLP
jgi:ABC-type amino acid transport substrate-binding protein